MILAAALRRPASREAEGQGLVEYALLLMLVALACVGAVTGMGQAVKDNFWDIIQNVLIPAM